MDTSPVKGTFVTVVGGLPKAARKDQRGRLVACSEGSGIPKSNGQRVGEDHHHAVLTNAQVDEIRDRHEAMQEAQARGGPRVALLPLAREFKASLTTIKDVVYYRRRNVYPARWKRVDN